MVWIVPKNVEHKFSIGSNIYSGTTYVLFWQSKGVSKHTGRKNEGESFDKGRHVVI